MSKANQNIDETFRNAFQGWEADYSMQEMNADWDAFSRNIPQPQQPKAPQKPMVKSPLTNPWSAAKILGLSSAAGIIITAATLLFNNSDSNENNKLSQKSVETDNLPKTEQVNTERSINTASETIKSQDLKENGNDNEAEATNFKEINQNENTVNSQSLANTTSANITAKNNISLPESNNLMQPQPEKANNIATKEVTNRTIELNDTSICQSAAIRIYNSNERNSEMRISWGDGKTIKTSQPSAIYTYETPGIYELKIEKNNNETITRSINVKAKPVAHFINNQSNGLSCKFRNTSENANGYKWFFGDNRQPQSGYNAEYTFPDTGRYPVKLVAFSNGECTDTLVQMVHVSSRNNYKILNVFTPNNDGSNDVFEINIENPEFYELIIMDRAGEIVFHSQDINNSWNGISQKDGRPCLGGIYFYSIRYRLPGENLNQLTGNVTLIR
jgi:gliding motility-associated-like protein